MRRAELVQLFEHADYVWAEVRRAVPDSLLSRAAPGSGWPALRDCLGHILVAQQRWVPAIVDVRTAPLPAIGPRDFLTWQQLDAERSRLRRFLGDHLAGWDDEQLAVLHTVDVDGTAMRYSRGELIAHLLLHERGHHGDLTTLLWQHGIDPDLALDFRFSLTGRQVDP